MWGPQQTRRDTCRPLQAWSFVGQLCMCSKWALPARRHWGAHFMVSPLTAVAHSPLLCVCVCVCRFRSIGGMFARRAPGALLFY